MDICFEGIGQAVATFATKKELASGLAVTMTGSGEVGLGNGNSPLCGVTVGAERGGAVAVQIGGVARVGYSGGALEAGWQELACDGAGKLTKQESGGMKYLVLAVDEGSVVIRL